MAYRDLGKIDTCNGCGTQIASLQEPCDSLFPDYGDLFFPGNVHLIVPLLNSAVRKFGLVGRSPIAMLDWDFGRSDLEAVALRCILS